MATTPDPWLLRAESGERGHLTLCFELLRLQYPNSKFGGTGEDGTWGIIIEFVVPLETGSGGFWRVERVPTPEALLLLAVGAVTAHEYSQDARSCPARC